MLRGGLPVCLISLILIASCGNGQHPITRAPAQTMTGTPDVTIFVDPEASREELRELNEPLRKEYPCIEVFSPQDGAERMSELLPSLSPRASYPWVVNVSVAPVSTPLSHRVRLARDLASSLRTSSLVEDVYLGALVRTPEEFVVPSCQTQ